MTKTIKTTKAARLQLVPARPAKTTRNREATKPTELEIMAMPIGDIIGVFVAGMTKKDKRIAHTLYCRFADAVPLPSDAPKGATAQHLSFASLMFAHALAGEFWPDSN